VQGIVDGRNQLRDRDSAVAIEVAEALCLTECRHGERQYQQGDR
jgi:hypothetical protein